MKKTTIQNIVIIFGLIFCGYKICSNQAAKAAAKPNQDLVKILSAIKSDSEIAGLEIVFE
jgi:hypothetical protein